LVCGEESEEKLGIGKTGHALKTIIFKCPYT
jgi:hypothetical protein